MVKKGLLMDSLLNKFSTRLNQYNDENKKIIMKAANMAAEFHKNQKRASGEPYIIHPISVATILIDMNLDTETIVAALLHDVIEDTEATYDFIKDEFGIVIANLVDGVTKITDLNFADRNEQETESIRKILIAMTNDIRVILIKLADKLHNLSTIQYLSKEKKIKFATETLDIYAPLAERLGISWMRAEIEDLCLKTLNPKAFDQISKYISDFKDLIKNENFLEKIKNKIIEEAAKNNIRIKVKTRAKHIYSIYRKVKVRKIPLKDITDVIGIRILCDTNMECYTLLGLVHSLWQPISGTLKDYIATPKANNYQSLHTAVIGPNGLKMEIQIRTHDMDNTAEHGIAAHWIYKSKNNSAIKSDDIAIINKLKMWKYSDLSSTEFLDDIKRDLLKDTIYVFTPKGQIVELPKDATPIDFAYHIHSEIGEKCIGAKVDGVIVPINSSLKNSQIVEIQTSRNAHPRVNWLRFVKTSSARSKIKQWLNNNDKNYIIESSIIAQNKNPNIPARRNILIKNREIEEVRNFFDKKRLSVTVENEKNMLIKIASCCSPLPGDDIIGYVSRGRGIIVHKKSCKNLPAINEIEKRMIKVSWEISSPKKIYSFNVVSRNSNNLFSEVENTIKNFNGHLIEGKLSENDQGQLIGKFTIELENSKHLKSVIKNISSIPNIIKINQI